MNYIVLEEIFENKDVENELTNIISTLNKKFTNNIKIQIFGSL